jgi:zinc protease
VQHVLENGLRLILQENHSAPVVALQMWVNVGSADDPDDLLGLAHVLEHMVFKGTARRSEGQIAKEIEGAGGQINAWTAFDQTVFHVVLPSRFSARGLDILADAMQNARFDAGDLERELQVILEEIKQGEDSPTKVVSRELFGAAYREHPYGRPVVGRAATVRNASRARVAAFFKRWYVPSNMTMVAVGDFAASEVVGRARRLFAASSTAAPRRRHAAEPAQQRLRVVVKQRDTQEAYVSLAFHIPGLADPATPAVDLAAIILGQGDSSRLVRRLKHDLQLVTDIYAYSYTPGDPGLLVVSAATVPGKLLRAVQAITEEVLALGVAEVTTDELRRAKTIIESDAVYQKETVQGQARKLGFFHTVAGSVDFEDEYNRRAAAVTAADIRTVAERYLRLEGASIAALSPNSDERGTAQDLQQAAAVARGRVNSSKAQSRDDSGVVKVTLGNGARLLVMRDISVPLVAMRAVWNGGLRYETQSTNGINNLLAALATRGTLSRTADQINAAVEGMAGSIGGFSGHNSFGVRSELLARHWEQGMEILADCLLNPALRSDEVERERRQLIDDIRAQQDNLSTVALQLFSRTLYRQHPYRMDPLGTVESVSALSRDQLVDYYRRRFHASNMVLAIVGDVDPQRVKEKFEQLFGSVPRRAARAADPAAEPPRTAPQDVYFALNKQQAHVVVGYPGTTMRSKDRFALEVLASLLSGAGGRLFLELRDRRGLAYHVGAYSLEGIEPGYFAVHIATSPEKVQAALAGIDQQLRRLRDQPVPAAELKRVQRYLIGSFEISLQRKSTVASLLAFNEAYGLGHRTYARYVESIMSVTAEDLQRVARRYLADQRRVLAVVKPEELAPGAAKRLGEARQAGSVDPSAPAPPSPRKAKAKGKARKAQRRAR